MRWAALCALLCMLSFSSSASAEDFSWLPEFQPSRTYSVSGEQLNRLRADLINSAATLKTVSESFARYKTQTLALELTLGALTVISSSTAIYFAGRSARWW